MPSAQTRHRSKLWCGGRNEMRYALVGETRQEAKPGLSGVCPGCGKPMVAKCGEIRIWHWAHPQRSHCDPWWEGETEWHRNWKDRFPADWQEIVHRAENGEHHIADVRTDRGWVLEFQHSYIKPEERRSREAFYPQLVWIVDGTRRQRDQPKFNEKLKEARQVYVLGRPMGKPRYRIRARHHVNLWRIDFPKESALLRDWAESTAPMYIDFGGCNPPEDDTLWRVIQIIHRGVYLAPMSRSLFLQYHTPEATEKGMDYAKCLSDQEELFSKLTRPDPFDLHAEMLRKAKQRLKRNQPTRLPGRRRGRGRGTGPRL